jgi:hypothetical protein
MRTFNHIATLAKKARLEANAKLPMNENLSQSKLSYILGYKNGQYISNVERALCSVPERQIVRTANALGISERKIRNAMAKDYVCFLDESIKKQKAEIEKENQDAQNSAKDFFGGF